MKKRILLVINGTDFGGTESALFQTAIRLLSRGQSPEVLSLKPLGRVGEQLQVHGVPTDSLAMSDSVSVLGLGTAVRRLTSKIESGGYDIIHSFLPRANVVSRLANRCAKRPGIHISSERSTDFQRARSVLWLNRWTSRWTDRVLAVTPRIREILVERDGVDPAKIVVLGNGIDLEAADGVEPSSIREGLGIGPSGIVIGFVGRLVPDKGLIYLFRAFGKVLESVSEAFSTPTMIKPDPSNRVYWIPCECGKFYIGETGRNLPTRLKEHPAHRRRGDFEKSAIVKHSHIKDHQIDWQAAQFITPINTWHPIRIRKAIEIFKHDTVHRFLHQRYLAIPYYGPKDLLYPTSTTQPRLRDLLHPKPTTLPTPVLVNN